MQILVVEDEQRMAELLAHTLQEEGHQVVVAGNGREGFAMALSSRFDAIVLDAMLPGMDGFAVVRKLRESRNQTPVLMLTARDGPADIVSGLDAGADDYLAKPFSIEVLLARLRAVSRRGDAPRAAWLEIREVKLDPASRSVTCAGHAVSLTPLEYKLLELLMRNRGRAVSRDSILESVWGFDHEVSQNNLEVFVRQLRHKVDTREPKLIHTLRGFGYMMREPEQNA
jgi:DNA-binding response OmpR family regulator